MGRRPKNGGLTPLETQFVSRFIRHGNAKRALREVGGVDDKDIPRMAHTVLVRPQVQQAINDAKARITEAAEISTTRVTEELANILMVDPIMAFDDDGATLPLSHWPEELRRALSGMDVQELYEGYGEKRRIIGTIKKMRFWSKTEAATQLLRRLGGYAPDKVDLTVKDHSQIVAEAIAKRKLPKGGK